MQIELNKLYNYLFGDWADVESTVKKDLPLESKEKIINKRKAEIRTFFSDSKHQLRPLIRKLGNSHLEKILFENDTDQLNQSFEFSDEKFINQELDYLEGSRYGILKDEKGNIPAQARKMFHEYYKMAKVIADYYEHNNDYNNSTAFAHAYKMLIVFGDDPTNCFTNIDKYLKNHNYLNVSDIPLHDALIYTLPTIAADKIHLSEWTTLIQKNGYRIFRLFNMAPAIEKQLGGRCPQNLKEAVEAAQTIRFKNAKQFPELADLFMEYNLHEDLFNRSLEVESRRKKSDKLPNIIISGGDIQPEYSDYHLVKLPVNDPRAYVLGHITNCCQSMGGHSETCVIDGITRENNGFYVLLKSKKSAVSKVESKSQVSELKSVKITSPFKQTENLPPQIDYANYEIVGQGYAWLSMQNNLVFDSWENKSPDRDDKIIVTLLEQFAKQVTDEKVSPILRVTIGIGGKTPDKLRENGTNYAEKMKEGKQYGDSTKQSTIFCNEERRKQLLSALELNIKNMFEKLEINPETSDFTQAKFIKWLSDFCYSEEYAKQAMSMLTPENIKILQSVGANLFVQSWDVIRILFNANLLTTDNIDFLPQNSQVAIKLCKAFAKIKLAGFEVDEVIRQRVRGAELPIKESDNIITVLNILKNEGLDNHPVIRKNAFSSYFSDYNSRDYANEAIESYILLKEAKLDTNLEVIKFLFTPSFGLLKATKEIIKAHSLLKEAKLANEPDIIKIILNQFHAVKIAEVLVKEFSILKNANLDQDPEVRACVLSARLPEIVSAEDIVNSYRLLKDANLISYKDIRDAVLRDRGRVNSTRLIIKLISLLEEAGRLHEPDIRTEFLFLNHSNYYSEKIAIEIIDAFIILKNAGFDDDQQMRTAILSRQSRVEFVDNLLKANAILEPLNLNKDNPIRIGVFNYLYPINAAEAVVCLHSKNLEKNSDILSDVMAANWPKEAALAICSLHAAHLESPIIRREVLHCRDPQLAVQAMLILKENQLAEDSSIRGQVLNSQSSPEKAAAAFQILKTANLQNNDQMRSIVSHSYHAIEVAEAFEIIKNANLQNNTSINNIVGSAYNAKQKANEIVTAHSILKEAKLETNLILYDQVIRNIRPVEEANKYKSAFLGLNNLHLTTDIFEYVSDRIIYSYHPQDTASKFIDALASLKEANILQDNVILNEVLHHCDSREAALAIVLLKGQGLEHDKRIKSFVLPNIQSKEAAKRILQLKEVGLENNDTICRLFIDSPYPSNLLKAFVKLKEAKLDHENDVLNSVRDNIHCEHHASRIINAYSRLRDANLLDNGLIRSAVIRSQEPDRKANDFIKAFAILKTVKLEEKQNVLNSICTSYGPLEEAQSYVNAILLLNESKLENNINNMAQNLIFTGFNAERTAKYIVNAITKLREFHLDSAENCEMILSERYTNLEYKAQEIIDNYIFKTLKPIHAFVDQLQQTIENLPDKTWRIFSSVHHNKKTICLSSINLYKKILDSIDKIDKDEAESRLLTILVKFHGELVAEKSDRYLKKLRSFLSNYNFSIPDTLRIDSQGQPNNRQLFETTLKQFNAVFTNLAIKLDNKAHSKRQ